MTPVGQSAVDRVGGPLGTCTTENWSALTCVLLWPGLSFTALFRTDRSCCGGRRTTQFVPCFLALMVLLVSAVAALPCPLEIVLNKPLILSFSAVVKFNCPKRLFRLEVKVLWLAVNQAVIAACEPDCINTNNSLSLSVIFVLS